MAAETLDDVPALVESSESEAGEPEPKRSRGAALKYALDQTFPSADEAHVWLPHSDFTKHKEQDSATGIKAHLRCKAGKAKSRYGAACPARAFLLYHADSQSVSLRRRSWEELQAGWAILKTEYEQLPADHLVHATLEYLEAEWLSPERRHWFEGAGPNRPSTNNALESMNGHLKSGHTLRARLPVLEFLGGLMERLVPAWSRDRAPACPTPKRFAELPTLSLPKWKEAYAFAHEGRTIKARREGAVRLFFVKAKTGELELTEEVLGEWEERAAERSWATWADFVRDRSAFWIVRLRDEHWRAAVCDCPVFQKDQLCKHSLGLPIRLRLPGVEVPAAAKTLPLDGRRRPGRPALARRALIVQP